MAFTYLTNIPVDDAREAYLQALIDAGLEAQTEFVDTAEANHRVTAEAIYAHISAPHYDACAMDGIALQASATYGAAETNPIILDEGSYHWVNTGDPLPADSDCVVMVEDVIEQDGRVTLYAAATPWQHVRQIGEDISAGDMIVPSYTELLPATLGAILAAGVLSVNVFTRPVVGIIPTGNELVSPTDNPGGGDIIEFNSVIFAGMLQDWGCRTKVYPIAPDTPNSIEAILRTAIGENDLVVINAGSSAGKKDYTAEAMRSVGEVVLHGVAIKPGKPTVLGFGQREVKTVPIVGLPGYPVSGILVLEQLIKPVVSALTGRIFKPNTFVEATISRRLNSTLKYLEYVRARVGNVGGKLVAVPLNRGAGVVSSFVKADGIIHIPQNTEGYEAGENVRVQLLRDLRDIEDTLVITGSHDPLLDEVADIMRLHWPESNVASSHVGSMGGIMALKRGEAHLGGIHLLDEESGEYNLAYLRRYFPEGGVSLVSCVLRTQGLMVPKENPLEISGIKDLARVRYVNRQKGSGTRILIDYLARQQGIDTRQVRGYEREEFTHTAVAAAIAAGSADAGLGIYSAAKIYNLGFLPVSEEQYDLVIANSALETEPVRRFLEIIKGEEFAARLERLGGYQLNHPGEVRQWN